MSVLSRASRIEDPKAALVFVGTSEMAQLMRATDWSATALGPVAEWSQSLCAAVRLMLTSRFPMWLGWGDQLTFLYNDAYGAMSLGAKHPWALGKPSSTVWSEIWPEIWPRIERVLKTGGATWDESLRLFLERNGYPEETYHTFSYSPLHDDSGTVRGNFCVVTEETERAIGDRRLAMLKQLAERLATTSTVDDVCAALAQTLESDARDVPFSLTYLAANGAPPELSSSTGIDADHPALLGDGGLSAWPYERAMTLGHPVLVTLPEQHAWPAGPWSRPPSQALVLPIAQRGQAPEGVVVTAINPHRPLDDTYRSFLALLVGQVAAGLASAHAHEEERRKARALAELDRAKTAFFSNVSHELRTPLTLLLGPLEDIRARGDLPSDVQREVDLARRNGTRLLRLVNTLLDFSRIEAGRAQARYEPTDVASLTTELASVFSSAMEHAGLGFEVRCEPIDEPVYVDRAMWEKIVLNLLSNAFKYTLEGRIEVQLAARNGTVELTVRDTGTGIPAHEMPRLFERFHRVEGARGRTHEGTGIGLALVHELVKLHGGALRAQSELGRGSVFSVEIPLGRAHLPHEHVQDSAVQHGEPAQAGSYVEEAMHWLASSGALAPRLPEGGEPPAGNPLRAPSAPRILLADDNADMRQYIERLLSPLWEVETAADGRAALEAIRKKRPALLVTDVMMPQLDGFGLLEAVRADARLRDLPVLMLSARAGEEARLDGLEAGADDYLAKPFTARELIARVEAQLLRARVRAVEESHARRLSSVFEQAPAAIALVRGPDHVFELANPLYAELVNHASLAGSKVRDALPELVEQGVVDELDRVYRTGQAHRARSQQVVLGRGEGGAPEQRIFDFVYQPLLDAQGEVEGIAIVVHDVTELAMARKAAEVASVAKDEFFAMLGHELRNPLMPIMTALELIKQRGDGAAERERRIIERQVQHLVTLVDDLLDVSRITRGKLQLNMSRVELYDVVTSAIETASPLLEKRGHTLHVDVPRVGLWVDADPARLAQVFGNLLNNAAKYTQPGGEIAITGRVEAGRALISVRDNGIGIAPAMLPRVFDLFAQERQALDRAQGGLGLGLAIVRSLVELHSGNVIVASDGVGKGATFTIALPLAVDTPEAAVAEAPAARSGVAAAQAKILVVDDNEDIALMITDLLAMWGYETRFALDAVAALAIAESFQPDLAVLDIGLPVMDGYELARRFAGHPALSRARLVAVTGYGQEQDRERARAAGFAAHLVKPVDLERLRAVLVELTEPAASASV